MAVSGVSFVAVRDFDIDAYVAYTLQGDRVTAYTFFFC